MKTTIAAIESACAAAESAIATYTAEKTAIVGRRTAGEVGYPAAAKLVLAASVAPARAVQALQMLASAHLDEMPSEALMVRCDAIDAWKE